MKSRYCEKALILLHDKYCYMTYTCLWSHPEGIHMTKLHTYEMFRLSILLKFLYALLHTILSVHLLITDILLIIIHKFWDWQHIFSWCGFHGFRCHTSYQLISYQLLFILVLRVIYMHTHVKQRQTYSIPWNVSLTTEFNTNKHTLTNQDSQNQKATLF